MSSEVDILEKYEAKILEDIKTSYFTISSMENYTTKQHTRWTLEPIVKHLTGMKGQFKDLARKIKYMKTVLDEVTSQMEPLLVAVERRTIINDIDQLESLVGAIKHHYEHIFDAWREVISGMANMSNLKSNLKQDFNRYKTHIEHHLKLMELFLNQEGKIIDDIREEFQAIKKGTKRTGWRSAPKKLRKEAKKEKKDIKTIEMDAEEAEDKLEHTKYLLIDGGPVRNLEEYLTGLKEEMKSVKEYIREIMNLIMGAAKHPEIDEEKRKIHFMHMQEDLDAEIIILEGMFNHIKMGRDMVHAKLKEFEDMVDNIQGYEFKIDKDLKRVMDENKKMYKALHSYLKSIEKKFKGSDNERVKVMLEDVEQKLRDLGIN